MKTREEKYCAAGRKPQMDDLVQREKRLNKILYDGGAILGQCFICKEPVTNEQMKKEEAVSCLGFPGSGYLHTHPGVVEEKAEKENKGLGAVLALEPIRKENAQVVKALLKVRRRILREKGEQS